MIDITKFTNIFASLYKSDKDTLDLMMSELVTVYRNIQTALMTSNDFTYIRYLQGAGNVLSSLIVACSDAMKASENKVIVGGKHE